MPIQLTTPYTVGGPQQAAETDPYVAVMGIAADQQQKTLVLTVYPATALTVVGGKTTAITPGVQVPPVTVTVNCVTGSWYASNGLGGTLTGASLTGAQSWLAAALTPTMKDQAEAAWISMGIFPGTQVSQW